MKAKCMDIHHANRKNSWQHKHIGETMIATFILYCQGFSQLHQHHHLPVGMINGLKPYEAGWLASVKATTIMDDADGDG